MEKLQRFLSKWLLPIAAKLEKNKQLSAIRKGMMTLVPVTLVGSVPMIFMQLPNIPNAPQWLLNPIIYIGKITNPIYFATFGCMSLFVAAFIGYYYALERKVWDIGSIVTALMSFITVATLTNDKGVQDFSYYSGTGIFVAIIVALISVEILHIFKNKLKFTINLGEGVPTPIKRSFENLWPILFSVLIIAILKFFIEKFTGVPVVKIVEVLFKPLTASVNTLPGIIFILFIQQLLWWFGIHGYAVTSPIWLAVAFQNADANAAMLKAGVASSEMFILTPNFMWDMASLSGSGIIGALAILMLFSKSKRYKAIGKLSIIPEFFGIGEPVLFGIPVILNPIMFIPLLITSPVAATIGWYAIKTGFVQPFKMVGPYLPIPFGATIASMDYKYVFVAIAIIASAVVIYYPFFKIVEKQAIEKERAAEGKNVEKSLDDFDFDFE